MALRPEVVWDKGLSKNWDRWSQLASIASLGIGLVGVNALQGDWRVAGLLGLTVIALTFFNTGDPLTYFALLFRPNLLAQVHADDPVIDEVTELSQLVGAKVGRVTLLKVDDSKPAKCISFRQRMFLNTSLLALPPSQRRFALGLALGFRPSLMGRIPILVVVLVGLIGGCAWLLERRYIAPVLIPVLLVPLLPLPLLAPWWMRRQIRADMKKTFVNALKASGDIESARSWMSCAIDQEWLAMRGLDARGGSGPLDALNKVFESAIVEYESAQS